MNKNKFKISNIFNGKLFVEAFKQIRVVGLIFFVCLNALAIFAPILLKSDTVDMGLTRQILFDIESSMFPLISLIYIVAPIMFIILFKFLIKRNGSDFHHSLPVKRSCLFITYISAILSWLLLLAISYTTILVISANLCTSLFVIDYSVIIAYLVNIIVSSFIIIGVFSIGTAISGTLTSNVIFSLGLLIIPRLLFVAFYDLVASSSYTLTYNSGLLIFNPKCNMPFALITDMFEFIGGADSILGSINANTLYTFVLAVIYTFIGLRLFITRPSEVAGKSFRNKKIFSALKYGTGLLISLILVVNSYYIIYEEDYEDYDYYQDHIIEYLLVIVAIAVAMFALEAATSKSIKKGLKTMLATPFILILDAIIIFGAISVTNYYNNEEINPDSVDYICVEYTNGHYSYDIYDYYYSDDYDFVSKIKEVKITDKDIIDMIVNAYNSDRAEKQNNSYQLDYWELNVSFDSTFGKKNRCVYLTQHEYELLGKKLFNNNEVLNRMYSFPDKNSSALWCGSLTIDQTHTLYDTLINELKSLPADKLYPDLYELFNYDESVYGIVDNIYVTCYENGYHTSFNIPISSLTPKSFALYMTYVNENSKNNLLSIMDVLKGDYRKTSIYLYGYINNLLSDGTTSERFYYDIKDKYKYLGDDLDIIRDSLSAYYNTNKPFDYNEVFSDKYYIAKFTLAHNDDRNFYTSDFYTEYDMDYGTTYDNTLYGSFFLLLPKDSTLLDGLVNYYEQIYFDEYQDIYYDETTNTYYDSVEPLN